jgi:hypothetical protein
MKAWMIEVFLLAAISSLGCGDGNGEVKETKGTGSETGTDADTDGDTDADTDGDTDTDGDGDTDTDGDGDTDTPTEFDTETATERGTDTDTHTSTETDTGCAHPYDEGSGEPPECPEGLASENACAPEQNCDACTYYNTTPLCGGYWLQCIDGTWQAIMHFDPTPECGLDAGLDGGGDDAGTDPTQDPKSDLENAELSSCGGWSEIPGAVPKARGHLKAGGNIDLQDYRGLSCRHWRVNDAGNVELTFLGYVWSYEYMFAADVHV